MPVNNRGPARGRIIYLMGASGVGKDSLIGYVLGRFPGEKNFVVTRRYVTRQGSGENSRYDLPVTTAEFQQLEREGFFTMSWEGYGYRYGIGRRELENNLENQFHCIINGSRRYYPLARQQYPDLVSVLVRADPGLRWLRLETRRRDNPAELATRLKNSDESLGLTKETLSPDHILNNDGPLERAGEKLITILQQI